MSGNLIVIRKYEKTPDGYLRVDVTSHNSVVREYLSPFFLGPVTSPDGVESLVMENIWQFSKVYSDMVDANNNPTESFFAWRNNGFADSVAHRHPHNGKPLYSWWGGQKLGYIDARKMIYVPCYAYCVYNKPDALNTIKNKLALGYNIALADFDGYNFKAFGLSYEDVLNNPHKIMGHGHVLAMMIERPDLVDTLLKNSSLA